MNVRAALTGNAQRLRQVVDDQEKLLMLAKAGQDLDLDTCPLVRCPHQRVLRQTLLETIEVLEGTRRTFKSKQLEVLRRKLTRVLVEHG